MIINNQKRAFTLIEILVVLSIIGLLTAVVVSGSQSFRARGRDSKVLADKEQIRLALIRAREDSVLHQYPGMNSLNWTCLKSSGTCGPSNIYSVNSSVNSALAPYLPSPIPQPPGTQSGQIRNDAYLYHPSLLGDPQLPNGTYIVWALEKPINECPGTNVGELETGIYYCAERLPR